MFIVSLTSIPPRFRYLGFIFTNLFNQKIKPDKVILNIPHEYKRFKNHDLKIIPKFLYSGAEKDFIIEVNKCSDFGPATKIIPTLDLVEDEDDILFIDDDRVLDREFTLRFLEAKKENKEKCIVGLKYKEPNYDGDLFFGCGGVLINKKMMYINDYKRLLDKCPHLFYVDDIGLSMILIKNKVGLFSLNHDPKRTMYETIDDLYHISGNFERLKSNKIALDFLRKEFYL